MQLRNDALAEKILAVAKSEFLEKGYQASSMRSIATSAGVTTGAIYRYYANKEALFDALVSGPADSLYEACLSFSRVYAEKKFDDLPNDLSLPEADDNTGMGELLIYIYKNYDAFKLIISCSAGTKYQDYPDRLIDIESRSSLTLIHLMQAAGRLTPNLDERMVRIVIKSMFTGLFEIIAQAESIDTAIKQLRTLEAFYMAGWQKILGIL